MKVLNDLYDYGLKIYQDNKNFKFSLDSLLLSEFIEIKPNDKQILDICSGNAPIPLILAHKYPNLSIIGVEIQKEIYDLAIDSIKYNNLTDRIQMLNINALDLPNYFPGNNFDIITCNPPFFKVQSSALINANTPLAIARHEITITLEDIFNISKKYLKDNGRLYLVHRPNRLDEIMEYAQKYNLAIKKIIFIYTKEKEEATSILIKCVNHAKHGVKIFSHNLDRKSLTYQGIFNDYK